MAAEKVEISKAEYDTLVGIRSLMDKAWDSKDKGSAFRRLLKDVDPTVKLPEDVADSVIAPVRTELDEVKNQFKATSDRLDAFLKDTKDEKDTNALRADLTAAQKKFGLDEEGMTKVMQRMRDKSNPDVEAAAAWVASQAPNPQPISDHGISSISADLFGTTKKEDEFEALHTGGDPFKPGGWFDREATKILNEPTDQAA